MTRLLVSLLCLSAIAPSVAADEHKLTKTQCSQLGQYFGFGPMQIYRIKPGISNLMLSDLDGDGRTDVILWNSHQSRFELLYQRDPNAPLEEDEEQLERNEIASRGNMRRENVPVAYRVAAVEIADLTGDQRPDIVFFGEPKEIVILPGKQDGGFGSPLAVRAADGEPRGGALGVGDFNHDGLTDVVLLGKDVLQVFHQKSAGGLGKPVRIVHGVKNPGLLLSADIDGDGRDDLMIGSDDDQYGAYVCLQDSGGALSALRRIKVPDMRSMTFVKANGGDDLLAVESATGHLKHYRWQERTEAGGTADWPQRLYSYPLKVKSKRIPVVVGDVTGDGLHDCVAADPDAAQLILFKGTPEGLAAGAAFPGLMKTGDLFIADLDADGRNELLSVSAEEKTLGVSEYSDGRITFPKPMAISGEPLAVAVGALRAGDKSTCLAYVARRRPADAEDDEDYEDEDASVVIQLVAPADGRELQSWECGEVDDPSGLRFADVNQDGRNDLLLFSRYSPLQTYLQAEDGTFHALTGSGSREGLVKGARIEGFCLSDVTGDGKPEVLVAQKGLARALVVRDGQWVVIDQYNPETADAQITGLAVLPGKSDSPTVVMYDRKARDLLVLRRRSDRAYAVDQSMPIGSFDLSAMAALPVGKQSRTGLLLVDAAKLALFTPGETAPTLVALHTYETDAKDAWLGDAMVGDLNHDGIRDVVTVDMRKASIEILTTLSNGELVRAVRFQVFQGKRFSDNPDTYGEPRQVLVGELTGDQIDDLALIVHDRLIIYPGK